MLRSSLLTLVFSSSILVAEQKAESDTVAWCVQQTEMSEMLVRALLRLEIQGEKMDPIFVGRFVAGLELISYRDNLLVQLEEEKLSAEEMNAFISGLYEKNIENQNRVVRLAETIGQRPVKFSEAKTDMIVSCINARKK